jgi:hypothetical protein
LDSPDCDRHEDRSPPHGYEATLRPLETPNAASATIVPEIRLQQPATAEPTASTKTLSTCS